MGVGVPGLGLLPGSGERPGLLPGSGERLGLLPGAGEPVPGEGEEPPGPSGAPEPPATVRAMILLIRSIRLPRAASTSAGRATCSARSRWDRGA